MGGNVIRAFFSGKYKTAVEAQEGLRAEDMFSYISTCPKNIRLCVISYAGLTNEPEDVKKSPQEVVVDVDGNIEVLSRHALLHDQEIRNKFKSRHGFCHRS
ncbi:hypothetical protein BCR42DRAFT_395274 [Absidia repens]|uniref:Uncharacterized protein n=1 Tax=Absidia repens TaxID=90262 RepID=A0A1X2I8I8_9FUNG|nr:hypothetical protein BCR42DRAFT_395274 [Absidia repens]